MNVLSAMNCTNPFQSTTCHGRGNCTVIVSRNVSRSACVCESGFTGRSDWINLEFYGGGCNIRKSGVKIAYGVLLLVSLLCFTKMIKYVLDSRAKAKKEKKEKKGDE